MKLNDFGVIESQLTEINTRLNDMGHGFSSKDYILGAYLIYVVGVVCLLRIMNQREGTVFAFLAMTLMGIACIVYFMLGK